MTHPSSTHNPATATETTTTPTPAPTTPTTPTTATGEATPLEDLLQNPRVRRWGPFLAIALLAFLFYLPTIRAMFIWDDALWITNNTAVQSPNGLQLIWTDPSATPQYYPLVFTTFWIETHLTPPLHPGPDGLTRGYIYHFDNLLLHIGSALVIFALLKRLKLPGGTLGAWVAAAVFAIHPVNVASVAWAAERKNVLCGIFFFSALYFGLRFFAVTADEADDLAHNRSSPRWGFYAALLLFFIAAVLSKTVACTLPALILLMIWWRRGRFTLREFALTLPMFLAGGVLALITAANEAKTVGATGPEFHFSFLQRILIAGNAFWFYIGKLLAPTRLVQIYSRFPINAGQPISHGYLYLAPLAAVAAIAILFALRKKLSRGPIAALLFFSIAILPALGFINYYSMVFSFVADHYQYLACIAIIVLLVETLLFILRRLPTLVPTEDSRRFVRLTTGLLVGGILLSLGTLAYGVSDLYTDDISLWQYNVDNAPTAFYAWNNLAAARDQRGDAKGAIQDWEQSIRVKPDDWRAYHDLGMYYLDHNQLDAAARYLDASEKLMPAFVRRGRAAWIEQHAHQSSTDAGTESAAAHFGPDFVPALTAENHQDWDTAIAGFRKELQQNPNNAQAWFELGNCYAEKNDFPRAADAFQKAIDKRPKYAQAYFNLGMMLRAQHKEKQAIAALQEARRIDPTVLRHIPGLLEQAAKQMDQGK